jgi:CHAD domain-containing protein
LQRVVVNMSMNRHTEQEWQFTAQDLESARHWLAAQPQNMSERRFAARPTLDLQDTYYDSPDWMIFRAGYALRVRRALRADQEGIAETEITLKSLQRPHNGVARRTEFSESVGDTNLDEVLARGEGIGGRIRELVGARPLAALFLARTRRERQQLLEADTDLPLAEVDLDETSIETAAGGAQELRRVEVECINAEPAALTPMVEQLRDAAQLQPVAMSKFRAGLAAAGLDPSASEPLGATDIHANQPFAEAQLAMLRRYLAEMMAREAEVRTGSAKAVHEMRVAARHLEVLLRVFRGYGPGWAIATRPRVHGLIKALGAVRDGDVQLAFLDSALDALAPEQRKTFEPMRERLTVQRSKARAHLLHALDSPAVQVWTRDWQQHLRDATPGSARAQRTATAVVARDLIRGEMRALRKRARRLGKNSSADEYHEVRIRTKRLRYTLDAFESLYGETAPSFVRALGKLQTVLGEYHDSTMRERHFTELVASGPHLPSSTSFVVGRLVERDASAIDNCRERFPKAYRRVHKRRWRELNAVMKQTALAARTSAAREAAG